jgi:hypothetical protein
LRTPVQSENSTLQLLVLQKINLTTQVFLLLLGPSHCCTQLQGAGVGSTRRHTAAFSSDAAAVPPTIGIASPGARSSRSVRSIGAKSNASAVSTFDRGDTAAAGYAQSPNGSNQQQLQLLSPGQLFDRSAGAAEDESRYFVKTIINTIFLKKGLQTRRCNDLDVLLAVEEVVSRFTGAWKLQQQRANSSTQGINLL